MRRFRHVLCLGALFVLALVVGCEEAPVDQSPERVVEAFIDRMRAVHGDLTRGRRALALMASGTRRNLEERAERASDVTGRSVRPEEILVPSRFTLAFEPVRYVAEVRGNFARVTVTGENPATEIAEVPCVREDNAWRVSIQLPELPPIQTRK